MSEDGSELNAIELATELTIAWLNNGNNRVAAEDVPAFLQTMHATVLGLAAAFALGLNSIVELNRMGVPIPVLGPLIGRAVARPRPLRRLRDGRP